LLSGWQRRIGIGFTFNLRWRELREPWNQPRGTERDDFDVQSFSLMLDEPSSGGAVAAGWLRFNSPDGVRVRCMALLIGNWRGHGLPSRILAVVERHARS
jgi:hypothetical protein